MTTFEKYCKEVLGTEEYTLTNDQKTAIQLSPQFTAYKSVAKQKKKVYHASMHKDQIVITNKV